MKRIKNILCIVLILTLIFIMTDLPMFETSGIAHAATMNINKKTLSLMVGEKAQLSISSTKKPVKWSSQSKKIATVTTKGKVTAIAVGRTKITAIVSGKKFYCSITVKAKDKPNPALAGAPFKAQEMKILNIDFVMPADWTMDTKLTESGVIVTLVPENTIAVSGISITIVPGEKDFAYNEIKSSKTPLYIQSYVDKIYTQKYGNDNYTVTDLAQKDLSTNIGTVLKTQYTLTLNGIALTQQIYDFSIGNLLIEIISENNDGTDLSSMIEYVINSVIVK